MAAGEEYVAAITAHEPDRAARRAFQELVLRVAAPRSCIFDFGAGPGIDAKFYAERGRSVIAYDNDARMCASLIRRCQAEIESGQVSLCDADYSQFLAEEIPALRRQHDIELVTCNFAPLNLIEDLPELFRALHELTRPTAKVLASVLNPWFVGDMRYAWWWSRRHQYWRQGWFAIEFNARSVIRRSRANFVAQAMPYFALEAVGGLPGRGTAPLRSAGHLALAKSRYMFLLFGKRYQ